MHLLLSDASQKQPQTRALLSFLKMGFIVPSAQLYQNDVMAF
jgi:hypothetical protein